MTDHTAEPLRWHYGPTDANPDPGRVMFFDDGAVCECGATDMNGALMARPAEPDPSTPTEPRRVVVCAKNDLPHVENDNCVDAQFNGVVQIGDQIVTEPLAQGGIVTPDAQPEAEHDGGYLAPADVLRAAADAADDAICRRLDHNQVAALIADAVWRLAYERGHAAGHGRAVAAVQRPDQRAYERGKAEGIAERLIDRDTLAAIVCAVRDDPGHQAMDEDVVCGNCEEIAKEIQQHVIAKTGGGQDGQ